MEDTEQNNQPIEPNDVALLPPEHTEAEIIPSVLSSETVVEDEETGIQPEISRAAHLKPWQFKPGQSGNPSGKPKGTVSLKTFAKNYIQGLTDEEKLAFLEGMDKKTIWEMAEDKAGQGVNVTGEMVSKVIKLDVE